MRGRIEGAVDGRVTGWAIDLRMPERRLTVTLSGGDGLQVNTCADCYRADLHRAGVGDGHHGFAVPISVLRGWRSIRASAEGIRLAPMGSDPLEGMPRGRSVAVGAWRLWIDTARRSGAVSGWAVDTRDPERRIAVALRLAGVVLARAQATRYRADLAMSDTDALHGFVLACSSAGHKSCEIVDEAHNQVLAKIPSVP